MRYKYLTFILLFVMQLISCNDDDDVKYSLINEDLETFFKENDVWVGTKGSDTITLSLYGTSWNFYFNVDTKIDGHLIYKASVFFEDMSIWDSHLNDGTIRNSFLLSSYHEVKDSSWTDISSIYFDITKDKKLILYNLDDESYFLGKEYKKVVLTNFKDIYPRSEVLNEHNKIFNYGTYFINISQSDSMILQTKSNGYPKYSWSYKEYGKDNVPNKLRHEDSISTSISYRYFLSEGNFSDYVCSISSDDEQITKQVKYQYDEPTLKLFDYPIKGESRILFNATQSITKPDNSLLTGAWYMVQEKDSTILLFENNIMKEYVYQRNTNNILQYNNNGEYSLERITNGYKDMILSKKDVLRIPKKTYEYKLYDNSLKLTQGNVSLIYKRLQ